MDTHELAAFIVAANRHTYAGNGPKARPLLEGSRQLEFSRGDYVYRDAYFGSDRFQGQSIVYFKSRPIWGMVYSGGVTGSQASPEADIYVFLKEALSSVTAEEPFRGPRDYASGGYTYDNDPTGAIESFHGLERIHLDGKLVYELHYAGGLIMGED